MIKWCSIVCAQPIGIELTHSSWETTEYADCYCDVSDDVIYQPDKIMYLF